MRQPVRVVLADDHDAFVEGLGMVLSAEDDLEVVALAGDGASALQAVRTHRPDVLVVDTHMPGPAVTELVRLVGQARPTTRVLLLAEDARLAPASRPDPAGGHAGMTRAVSARQLAEAIRAVAAGRRVVEADPPTPRPAGHASPQPRDRGAPEREGSPRPGGMSDAVHSPPPGGASDAVHSPRPGGAPGAVQSPRPGGVPGAVHGPGRPRRDDHAELLLRSLSERERQILAMLARGWSNRRIAETCFLSLNTVRTHVQNVLVKLGVHSKLEAAALAVRQGLVSLEDHPAQ
jgi:DNA-binding NarL/FixJ family response regulator